MCMPGQLSEDTICMMTPAVAQRLPGKYSDLDLQQIMGLIGAPCLGDARDPQAPIEGL